MRPSRRLVGALLFLLGVVTLGTLGFTFGFGLPPLDALYMTVITVSTVGFREVGEFGAGERLFTIALIFLGVGAFFYTFAALTEFLIEGRVRDLFGRRAMRHQIDALEGHIILCGYGRFGRAVAEELRGANVALVVIESDAAIAPELERSEVPCVLGSALEDDVLKEAGIARARALVIGTGSDADNVFIALSAREANPRIAIHARASSEAGARRLRLAGATLVISPYHLGGQRIANAILRPSVVEFIELATPGQSSDVVLEEVLLAEGCALAGATVGALLAHGVAASLVALKRGTDPPRLSLPATEVLRAGDRVVVAGDRESLRRLARLAEAPGAAAARALET